MKNKMVKKSIAIVSAWLLSIGAIVPARAAEVETVLLPLEVYGRDVISMALPAINEEGGSPFDFIMDPQGLIYETDAAKYGGGRVEEGANLLFRNHDGEYDFSRYSDRLSIRNQSNVPVIVTITANVRDLGEIDVSDTPDFEGDECSVYIAIVDDEGNEQPVSEDGEVSVSIEMRRAPEDAYYFRFNEDSGEYTYEYSADPEDIDFDTYSFGLVGYCNPNGNWDDISVHPRVTVTWNVEPLFSDDVEPVVEQEYTEADETFDNEETYESSEPSDQYEYEESSEDITDIEKPDEAEQSAEEQTAEDRLTEESPAGEEPDGGSDNEIRE